MRYTREWDLPIGDCVGETFEQITGYGQSYFWYCRRCIIVYAKVWLLPADKSLRIWQGISGLCPNCPGDCWTIPGSIEGAPTEGWKVPQIVARYQLDRELNFTVQAQHPYFQDDEYARDYFQPTLHTSGSQLPIDGPSRDWENVFNRDAC